MATHGVRTSGARRGRAAGTQVATAALAARRPARRSTAARLRGRRPCEPARQLGDQPRVAEQLDRFVADGPPPVAHPASKWHQRTDGGLEEHVAVLGDPGILDAHRRSSVALEHEPEPRSPSTLERDVQHDGARRQPARVHRSPSQRTTMSGSRSAIAGSSGTNRSDQPWSAFSTGSSSRPA